LRGSFRYEELIITNAGTHEDVQNRNSVGKLAKGKKGHVEYYRMKMHARKLRKE
jgi:hypothetical protein